MTSILDPQFKYVPAVATTPEYLREKFARIAAEQGLAAREDDSMNTDEESEE